MAESKIDPEIRIKPSENLLHFIQNYLDEDCPKIPENFVNKKIETLSILDVTWIQNYMSQKDSELRKNWPQFKYFHELMEESTVILPEPQIPPRNPDLEARIQRLKVQQAERDYKRMTQNVSGRPAYTEEPLANQSKKNCLSLELQWGSENQTCSVFKLLKHVLSYL